MNIKYSQNKRTIVKGRNRITHNVPWLCNVRNWWTQCFRFHECTKQNGWFKEPKMPALCKATVSGKLGYVSYWPAQFSLKKSQWTFIFHAKEAIPTRLFSLLPQIHKNKTIYSFTKIVPGNLWQTESQTGLYKVCGIESL